MSIGVSGIDFVRSSLSQARAAENTGDDIKSVPSRAQEKSPKDRKGGLNEKALSVVNRVKEKLTGTSLLSILLN